MKAFLGALEFQENEYEELKELYESLKTKQKPHTLFISCVDSRVVPNLITGTKPGELYVIRNMGNVIPPKTSIRSPFLLWRALNTLLCMWAFKI
ncbi:hypothetical protein ID0203_01790 [Helicobacter pylori]